MIKSKVTEILNIRYPILQGGMAWIADSSLAAAVSNAGGFGLIGCGGADAYWVENEIKKTRTLTDKPFGINIMLLNPNTDDIMDVICREKVKAVTIGAGNPGKYIAKLKEAGIVAIPVVASCALAIRAQKAGADALVTEGMEAGGHIGESATMSLVPQVADVVNIPIIAAGGIGDGRGMAAAFMLGAQAVQIGTRFLAAHECTVSEAYKDKVIKAKDSDSEVTGRSTGHPVRVLKNKLTREMLKLEKSGADPAVIEERGTGKLRAAVQDGDVDYGSVMAGQIAGLVRKRQSANEIIEEIMAETENLLKNAGKLTN